MNGATRPMLPDRALAARLIERAQDPERYQRWLELVAHAGYCRRPVRLRGQVNHADPASGELLGSYSTAQEPDGVLLKACGNRRAAACPACSAIYKQDAWQLVAAGLRGGKGVPDSVAQHPMLFATFTAPSFGAVHTAADPQSPSRVCRRSPGGRRCEHGQPTGCARRHAADDPQLGDPICPDCFDYQGAVMWNALAPELWRRTTIYIRRELAKHAGLTHKQLAGQARLSYLKVAEYQRRGLIHFHAVIRLDGPPQPGDASITPPPPQLTIELLEQAIPAAARHARVPHPHSQNPASAIGWGAQLHLRHINAEQTPPEAAAAYLAKYATKSTHDLGLHDHPAPREHLRRLQATARQLALEGNDDSQIGYRGHWSTKSRRYSTTFTALRQARAQHAAAARKPPGGDGQPKADVRLRYAGRGHTNPADAWLAASAHQARRQQRQAAKEETRGSTRPP